MADARRSRDLSKVGRWRSWNQTLAAVAIVTLLIHDTWMIERLTYFVLIEYRRPICASA